MVCYSCRVAAQRIGFMRKKLTDGKKKKMLSKFGWS